MRSGRNRFGAFLAASLVLCSSGTGWVGAAGLRSKTACLDSSSPSYPVDRGVVALLAQFGEPFASFVFDGSSGVSDRFFQYLSRTKCGVIMGYPVDLTDADPPSGLAFTKPYLTTAYVFVARHGRYQSELKPGMTIAVGMATAPHFYLAGAFGKVPNYTADTYQSQEGALDALVAGHADAAMVWKPSLVRYRASHAATRSLNVEPLHIAHAQWRIAALYLETDAAQERRFNAALARLVRSGRLESIVKPYEMERQQ